MSKKDTTQQGVTEQKPTGNPRRNDAMSEIIANARRERQEDVEETVAETPTETEAESPDEHENDPPPQHHEADDEEAGEPATAGADGDKDDESDDLVTIKVDGEERKVPVSQVQEAGIRALQKESAADRRLAEASQRMREVEEREQEVRALAEQMSQRHKESQGAAPSKADAQDYEAKARQVLQKIYDGEEDEAAEALAEVFAGIGRQEATQTQQIDANDLVTETASKVRSEIERETAIKQFRDDYKDLVEDPYLLNIVDKKAYDLEKEHPEWDPARVLKEAGDHVRGWVSEKTGKKDGLQDKRERKRTTETPRAAHARVPGEPEETPPSRSDVVANMRKQRGLPTT